MTSFLPSWANNVSRETFSQLEKYVALLQKWNKAINLVGKSTESEIWERHIADSLQLLPLIPESTPALADLGSGAGLPGMVLAIARPDIYVTLIEQDQRKAAFLQEVSSLLALKNTRILNLDIHKVTDRFPLITARALAPLTVLCGMANSLFAEGKSDCLFPKGKNFANELMEAQQDWEIDFAVIPSKTHGDSSIVSITKLSPKQGKQA